jgi:hypothetical protein
MDYRIVKKPTALKHKIATDAEVAELKQGVLTAQGLGDPAEHGIRQIDCYYRDNKTLVVPLDGPAELKPWIISGSISPDDCRVHYLANLKPAQG